MAGTNVVTIAELEIEYSFPDDFALNTGKTLSYIESLKELNRLPFSKGNIFYSDDKWDFSQYTTRNVAKAKMKFSFNKVDGALKDSLKDYVLLKVLGNKVKIQSINRNYSEVKKFFVYAQENHIHAVEDISINMVKNYLQTVRDKGSIVAIRFAKTVLKDFYLQYSANFDDIATAGLLALFEQDDYKVFKAHQNANKSAEIPQEYFDRFLSACIQMLDDNSLDFAIRGAAGIYIIMSQTGLRIGEMMGLTDTALKTIKLFNGQEANYLEYTTWKRENGNNTASSVKTYVNQLCKKAFLTLLELYKDRRRELGLDYLYLGGLNMKTSSYFPMDSESFRRQSWRFLVKMDDLGLVNTVNLSDNEYPMLVHASTNSQKIVAPSRFAKGTKVTSLTYPDTQQFRFHVCTELHNKGVSLRYVQKFMGHLTFDMAHYHVNPTTTPQEDMEYSLKVLRDVVSGKTKILGENKGLTDRIQEFIKQNNYNVQEDLEAICEALALKIPIRQKTGGVCIKSSQLRECSTDAATNDFYCAYGVCPNIFHFYYMIDITYRQCKELEEVIGINKVREQSFYNERGAKITRSERIIYPKQIQKNLNMLYTITTKRLIPELDELKQMVDKYGVEQIYMEHPDVQDILENLATIEEEVNAWKSLK